MENLKCGTKIKWGNWNLIVDKRNDRLTIEDFDNEDVTFELSSYGWLDDDFKILSKEDKEIDIDSIEELKHIYIYNLDPNVEKVDDRVSTNVEKINELIKAVKQLNKKLEGK